MKKTNLLILTVVIIALIITSWFLFNPSEKKQSVDFSKESLCQQMRGNWADDKCWFGDIIASDEELDFFKQELELLVKSCKDNGGTWVGGLDKQCAIDGVVYKEGEWQVMKELKDSCQEYGGMWLGQFEDTFVCEIDGIPYFGNWASYFRSQEECEKSDGDFIALSKDNFSDWNCVVDGKSYREGRWSRIEEMKESCLEFNGVWLGGDNFECEVFGDIQTNGQWVRLSYSDNMAERCQSDGGDWDSENRKCVGVDKDWCMQIVSDYPEIGALSYNKESASCILYEY